MPRAAPSRFGCPACGNVSRLALWKPRGLRQAGGFHATRPAEREGASLLPRPASSSQLGGSPLSGCPAGEARQPSVCSRTREPPRSSWGGRGIDERLHLAQHGHVPRQAEHALGAAAPSINQQQQKTLLVGQVALARRLGQVVARRLELADAHASHVHDLPARVAELREVGDLDRSTYPLFCPGPERIEERPQELGFRARRAGHRPAPGE